MTLTKEQLLKEQEMWDSYFPQECVPHAAWDGWRLRAEIAQDELHALREENRRLREITEYPEYERLRARQDEILSKRKPTESEIDELKSIEKSLERWPVGSTQDERHIMSRMKRIVEGLEAQNKDTP